MEKLEGQEVWLQIIHGDDLVFSGTGVLQNDTLDGWKVGFGNSGNCWIKEEKCKIQPFFNDKQQVISYYL